ncbi:uncharacterized CRM domain-containing protein At3g25440, chloroplastic-like [Chenopodium quinoa]|uniref:uncharacterized CRM domain-containing protein At3g25440, chloroplastic-like n=1 Tax=Chenopodium quinoa TaxID=63459 RepID=UPI000B784750|nr:uncharacterized CRM domain-containing protein At3g25440, chloroplastic-like [Chenopodium quinoa]
MFVTRNLQRQSLKTLTSLFNNNPFFLRNSIFSSNAEIQQNGSSIFNTSSSNSSNLDLGFNDFRRWMSTAKGRSMRSKVERRMQREAGKTQRQIRQAKKIKLKLMTEEERLIYNLRRAKKKVALLMQKLKKYELPELPPPRHDPELLTSEQLQAFKKIGFRNKNYCEVGVRGVFGGVVQNMHLHWKFHETVQVCCDNFPKERIKEMATILARLSGGIVVNVHNVKTIIMFRGRNYRQPKNLIPVNTLTKRKALFKARFEQALESQKLNIKKIEQQLRKKGISPDDPVAMASIQRVASTFFNAIDKKEGSPYVFREAEESVKRPLKSSEHSDPAEDSDQEELDKFIAEIEDAVDKEWAEEEAAEQEEYGKIRYRNKEEYGGRFNKPDRFVDNFSDDGNRGRGRGLTDTHRRQRIEDSEDEDSISAPIEEDSASEDERQAYDSDDDKLKRRSSRVERWNPERSRGSHGNQGFKQTNNRITGKMSEEESESENMFEDLDDVMRESDSEVGHTPRLPRTARNEYRNGHGSERRERSNRVDGAGYPEIDSDDSDEGDRNSRFRDRTRNQDKRGRVDTMGRKWGSDGSDIDEDFIESEIAMYGSDDDDDDALESGALRGADEDYSGLGGLSQHHAKVEDNKTPRRNQVSRKRNDDELWDSD